MKLQYIVLVWSALITDTMATLLSRKTSLACDGRTATMTDVPGQVIVQSDGRHLHTGAMISNEWVLTSAFYVSSDYNYNYTVRAATSDRDAGGSIHTVFDRIIHESFIRGTNQNPSYNDIALLRVNPPFIIDDTRQPMLLPMAHEKVVDGDSAVVSGWMFSATGYHDKLSRTNLTVMSRDRCRTHRPALARGQFCAFNEDVGECQLEDGAPLTVTSRLFGIASHGYSSPLPEVFSDVTYYRNWIKRNSCV